MCVLFMNHIAHESYRKEVVPIKHSFFILFLFNIENSYVALNTIYSYMGLPIQIILALIEIHHLYSVFELEFLFNQILNSNWIYISTQQEHDTWNLNRMTDSTNAHFTFVNIYNLSIFASISVMLYHERILIHENTQPKHFYRWLVRFSCLNMPFEPFAEEQKTTHKYT